VQQEPESSRATSAISEDWRVGIALWFVVSTMGVYIVGWISQIVAGDGGFEAALDVVARWTLSSGAHIEWSAPVLVTAAFALAAICAAPIQERIGYGSSVPLFALTATLVAATLTVWAAFALVALIRLAALEVENPAVWEQFGAVSGIFLAAPLGVVAGLSAGRFQLLPPGARLAQAREQVARVTAELDELTAEAGTRRALRGYRFARYVFPFLLAAGLVAVMGVALCSAVQLREVHGALLVFSAVVIYGFSAFCIGVGSGIAFTPTHSFVADGRRGRRPTGLGWIAGTVLLLGAATPVAVAASVSAMIVRDRPEGAPAEFAVLWLAVIGPILASALYASALLAPMSTSGHRMAARLTREKQLAKARDHLARLEEQASQSAAPSPPPTS